MQELSYHGSSDELAAFVAVGETGSFAAASVRLGRDASVVSKRIGQLERRLGVRLLLRTTRKVSLTEAGAGFFRRVQAVLEELASASAEASDAAATPQGVLRLSLPVTFGRQWVAPAFSAFLARHPRIRIDAHFTDRIVDIVGGRLRCGHPGRRSRRQFVGGAAHRGLSKRTRRISGVSAPEWAPAGPCRPEVARMSGISPAIHIGRTGCSAETARDRPSAPIAV